MYDAMFKNAPMNFETMVGPMQAFNNLMLDHTAKLVDFQVNAMKAYGDLGIQQLRAMSGVKDADSLQNFVQSQTSMVKTLSEKMNSDANTLVNFGKDFSEDMQKLAQSSASKPVKASKAA